MELALTNMQDVRFVADCLALLLLIKYFCLFLPTLFTYLDWRQIDRHNLKLEDLEEDEALMEVAQDVFHGVYVGYVMNADEFRSSYWASIRWKVVWLILALGVGIITGYLLASLMYSAIVVLELVIFHQAAHAVTKESESTIRAILGC